MTTERDKLARDLELLETIEKGGVGLTKREIDWLYGNLERAANGTPLTKVQRDKAYQIKDERCSQ